MKANPFAAQLKNVGLIASLPGDVPLQQAIVLADALLAAPVLAVEVVLSGANALPLIADLRTRAGDKLLVGAAEVDTAVQVAEAAAAGAHYISSTGWRPSLLDACQEHEVAYVPGIISTLGAATAFVQGCPAVRLHTGGPQGPDFVRTIHTIQPQLVLLLEVDAAPESIGPYAQAGADGVFVRQALYQGEQQTMADLISRARAWQKGWQNDEN